MKNRFVISAFCVMSALVLCSVTGCGNSSKSEEVATEACSHNWKLDGERPVCTICGEERDGTTEEAVEYLWKEDVKLDNGAEVTMEAEGSVIVIKITYEKPRVDYTMYTAIQAAEAVYNKMGYLSDDIKDSLDQLYEWYYSDAAIAMVKDSYQFFDTYCGSNLTEYRGELYLGTEMLGKYVNGEETFNEVNDWLEDYGYHHD